MRGGPHLDDLLDWAWDYGAQVTWRKALGGAWRVEIKLRDAKYGVVADSAEEAARSLMSTLNEAPAKV